jgi:murein DD-endopeptidase MepM/ murein hydrolase activator NlpD
MLRMNKINYLFITLFFGAFSLSINPVLLHAETAEELKQKIENRSTDIAQLEKEIASYQKQIDALSSQSASLQSTLKTLQLTRQKLEKNIALTQDKITAKSYEIQKLNVQISGKEGDINDSQRIVAKAFATMNEFGNQSLTAMVLGSRSISESFDSVEQLTSLQQGLYEKIDKLSKDKASLEANKKASEKAKMELLNLNKQLGNERAVILATSNEQADLLKETGQSEAKYKSILSAKMEEALAFQREISSYESQLKILYDPKLLPSMGSGALRWPLSNIFITQRFGKTSFSLSNCSLYKNCSHNGMDFAAARGTPVFSARAGVVVGVGNTDAVARCKGRSYGRWVFVKHDNGLSTVYGHLSATSVFVGQKVETGEVIAYSGNTGASTGPHLHFTVYPTQGSELFKMTSTNCYGVTIPVGSALDPADYL